MKVASENSGVGMFQGVIRTWLAEHPRLLAVVAAGAVYAAKGTEVINRGVHEVYHGP